MEVVYLQASDADGGEIYQVVVSVGAAVIVSEIYRYRYRR